MPPNLPVEPDFWTHAKDLTESLKTCVEIAAILMGGLWTYLIFVRQRQRYPRARIQHRIFSWPVGDSKHLVRVTLDIYNLGDILIRLESGFTTVRRVKPWPNGLLYGDPTATSLIPSSDTKIHWEVIADRDLPPNTNQYQLEPGESGEFHFDFVLGNEEVITVYSYLKNRKIPKRDIGWNLTSIFDLKQNKITNSKSYENSADQTASKPGN